MNYKTLFTKAFVALSVSTACCFSAGAVQVTKVTVEQTNTTDSYNMYDAGKMYFSGNYLVLDPNGDGTVVKKSLNLISKVLFATVDISETGVETVISGVSSLSVSPNPVVDELTFNTDIEGSFEYTICNMNGQIVMKGSAISGQTINVSSLAKGVYFVKINNSFVKFSKL